MNGRPASGPGRSAAGGPGSANAAPAPPTTGFIAGVLLLLAAAIEAIVGAGHAVPKSARASAQPVDAPCTALASRDASLIPASDGAPAVAVVTTTVGIQCAPEERALNLVLLVDASPQTTGQTLQALQTVLESAVRNLGLDARPSVQIGVVSYAGDVRIEGPLSRSTERTTAAIRNIRNRSGSCLSCGLVEAIRMLRAARGSRDATQLRDIVLLASAGADVGCEAVRQTAKEARAFGVVVVTTCQGSNRDCGCMSEAAAQSRYVLQLATWDVLHDRLLDLVDSRGIFHPIDEVLVVDALAPGFVYLDGGAPSGGIGNRLNWAFAPWSADAVTITLRASAVACGSQPLAVPGESHVMARFNPSFGGMPDAVVAIPNRSLEIPCAPTPPSTTATPPATATPTPPATPTPTREPPTVTVVPSPPPVARDRRLFLPHAMAADCIGGVPPRDWLLVMDASYSMFTTEVPDLGNAWQASRALGLAIVGHLRPGLDRVGVLAFGDGEPPDGLAEVPLAPCCEPALLAALAAGWRLDGSRADRALLRAIQMLGPPTAPRVIVVMTDGDLNQTPLGGLGAALAQARAAEAALDVVVFGADPDPRLIESVAAAGGRVLTPRGRSVGSIGRSLAGDVACR